ncbi:MAG: pyridoxine 5'-phosphate synthase [Bacteroidetes bacterium]|nr:pyridoxine 5'-phosphate synthase [Bacteroidota bacterium]MCX7906069.1 pyridoxine 5'-phosphate synthase [Bacteroidota bacterium]MDW8138197.1 pyridoxine 5'-phosphate synthase [Bacteroidota bacterium]
MRLLVNIDHVATLRNARAARVPDPVHAAVLCELAGADGIVFHLREDRRHITDRDVRLLKEVVRGKLDFEMAPTDEMVQICLQTRPHLATLVPERRQELTTEGGLDVRRHAATLDPIVKRLQDAGIEVSLFVDPDPVQIEWARAVGAQTIELHTGDYANAPSERQRQHELALLRDAAQLAHELGLRVHAGHGLDYQNFPLFKRSVPHVEEVSIGHAIIARAVLVGLEQAVRDMLALVRA